MDALYGLLDDLKSNAVPFVAGGTGVLAGLWAGKQVTDFAAAQLVKVSAPLAKYGAPLVPVVAGIAVVVYGRGKVPSVAEPAVEGFGLGLAAYGVGRLLREVAPESVNKYNPISGMSGLAAGYLGRARALRGLGATQLPPAAASRSRLMGNLGSRRGVQDNFAARAAAFAGT